MFNFLHRNFFIITFSIVIVGGIFVYGRHVTTNPRGFFIDESSIAYNAYLVSRTGHDEHGQAWPLYFRAFGEYKNPIYIYLLAAIFRLTGPSILAARLLSVTAGLMTAMVLGLLSFRLTRRRGVALIVVGSVLLTPWLFELSRVVLEVSIYPLVLSLFLLCVQRAATRSKWSWSETVPLALTLALLTYTYSIGRLLAPLLAIGLLFFVRRAGWKSVLSAWALYLVTLAPLAVFNLRNPGALTARFSLITYLKRENSLWQTAVDFLRHYAANINPWRLLVKGDPNAFQMAHVEGAELMLAATVVLAIVGAWLVLRKRRDPFWLFICYGLAVSIIPASLTQETFHMLHLSPVPVFLLLLSVPAVAWFLAGNGRRRAFLIVLAAFTLVQGATFQRRYATSADSVRRWHIFDAQYPNLIFAAATTNARRPIYLSDAYGIPGYIQAFWQATLQRVPLSNFVHLPVEDAPPPGSIVITTKDICSGCNILAESPPYTLYIAARSERARSPLPDNAFRAEISIANPPTRLSAGEQATVQVSIKNKSEVTWGGRDWTADPFQIATGNHWLDGDGKTIINDDGRAPFTRDVRPEETIEIPLTINAPSRGGNYQLEIDLVQEGVSWFGLKGSPTLRLPIVVK
jgi:4-amino-4-deoxy-L-arabinose transferase-like glycosyltransferase